MGVTSGFESVALMAVPHCLLQAKSSYCYLIIIIFYLFYLCYLIILCRPPSHLHHIPQNQAWTVVIFSSLMGLLVLCTVIKVLGSFWWFIASGCMPVFFPPVTPWWKMPSLLSLSPSALMVDHSSFTFAVFPPLPLALHGSTPASVVGGRLLQYLL